MRLDCPNASLSGGAPKQPRGPSGRRTPPPPPPPGAALAGGLALWKGRGTPPPPLCHLLLCVVSATRTVCRGCCASWAHPLTHQPIGTDPSRHWGVMWANTMDMECVGGFNGRAGGCTPWKCLFTQLYYALILQMG